MNLTRLRTYIQRSKSAPLEIFPENDRDDTYPDDASLLVAPHIHRIESLIICAVVVPDAIRNLHCHALPLEELDIDLTCTHVPIPDSAPFEGNLSSLRESSSSGVITRLPETTWQISHTIVLKDSIPKSSNAPSGRTVSLPHLHMLGITPKPAHSVLLDHLCIPIGASLILEFSFDGGESPLREYLPETTANLRNLSHIIAPPHRPGTEVRANEWTKRRALPVTPYTMDRLALRSLDPSILLMMSKLVVTRYNHPRPAEVGE